MKNYIAGFLFIFAVTSFAAASEISRTRAVIEQCGYDYIDAKVSILIGYETAYEANRSEAMHTNDPVALKRIIDSQNRIVDAMHRELRMLPNNVIPDGVFHIIGR